MKIQYKLIMLIISVLMVFFLVDCEKKQNDWGFALISMPQASIYDGDATNNYPVPLNNNPAVQDFALDTAANILTIHLGVTRSGSEALKAFTVSIKTRPDTIDQIISSGIISKSVPLPEDTYTLPETVTVPDGKRDVSFDLTVDIGKLIANYASLGGNKLLLAVSLDNPTAYGLNKALSTTIVIIDARQFMPAPPVENLIKGGDMEADSKQYWTWTTGNQEWGYTSDLPTGGAGGCLKWFNATSTDVSEVIYQEVQLVQGKQYQLSALVKIPEGANNFWIDFDLTDISPGDTNWDATGDFMGIWTTDPTPALDGDIRDVGNTGWGNYGNGLAGGSNGVFTATSSTMYVFVKLGVCCGGTFNGPVLIDEIKLKEIE